MATIVYEGAQVAGGGNLFKGIKFYFSKRVPSFLRWQQLVQLNGGVVVQLDTQADIIIADHARKDCPAGSISWKYVEESVKKGELEDIDDHRAGPVLHTARGVGSGGPTRKGRTPFTAEDDRILMRWVMQGERAGIPVRGNELFQQLEEKNPRHTYQSWRDRWIKYVQHQSRPQEADRSQSPSEGPAPAPRAKKTKSAPLKKHGSSYSQSRELRRQDTQPYRKPSSSQQVDDKSLVGPSNSSKGKEPEMLSTNPLVTKSAGGIQFSRKEINMLLQQYEDIVNIDRDKEIDAWARWAVEYPNHTAQEWRNYFVKELTPLVQKNKGNQSNQIRHPPEPKLASKDPETPPKPIADLDSPENEFADSQSTKEESIDPTLLYEELFEEGLLDLAEQVNVKEVTFNPTICGRQISLFRLWQVVKSDEFGGNDNVTGLHLWPQVASKLNFDKSQNSNAAKDLQACYEEILADFETVRDEFLQSYLIKEQLRSTIVGDNLLVEDEQLRGNDSEEEDFDDDLNAPLASPASHTSRKRTIERRANQNLSSVAGSVNKRQRINKGKGKEREIPSTPEEIINRNQMQSKPHQPSPLKSFQAIDDQDEEDSNDDLSMKPFKQSNLSFWRTPHKTLEPETQDFQFDFQEDEVEDLEQNFMSSAPLNGPLHHHVRGSRIQSTAVEADIFEESSTQSQTESQRVAELQDYIDHNISLGYPSEFVLAALEATTMRTGDAAYVMEELTQSGTIPNNVQGVWTAFDDAALKNEESSEFKRIVAKHGRKRIKLRREFLEDQKEAKKLLDEGSLE